MPSSEVRQRTTKSEGQTVDAPTAPAKTPAALAKAEDSSISLLDIARGIVLLLITSSAVSWFVTRESVVWGVKRPAFTRLETIKGWWNGPLAFTDASLKLYDGSNPSLPIYLAINGTIYDVSAGRKHYGPGGSYHFFAGADASRAFVTNCFDTDINPDMRGVEQMYMPLDDPEVDKAWTRGELKALKEQERRNALKDVDKALRHWTEFFERSGKYTKVGKVRREKGWETKGPVPTLCKGAEGRRKKREPPVGKGKGKVEV